MGNRLVQKTASVLMAFVLVCTCNSATMQPLAAFAVQGGDVPAETQETPAGDEPQGVAPGVEKKASQGDEPQGDVPEGQGGSVPDGTGEGLVGEFEPIVEGSEAPQPEKGQGEGSGVPHEVCGLDVSGEWDDDAQTVAWSIRVGEPASPEVDLSGYQLTLSFDDRLVMGQASLGDGRAVEAIGERAPGSFAYRFAADGDDLPLAPQTLTVTMKASSALLDALAAAEKTGDRVAVELDARLEAVEDAPALLDAVSLEERAEVVLKEAVEAPLLVEPPSVDEVAAIDEALAADEVQAPARPALTRMLRTSANENDVTNEVEQLSLGVVDFSYVDVAGVTHIIPAVQSTDKSVEYDFSSIPLASIDHMNMEVDFQIKKDDASRTINAGDIFKYDVPNIFTVADNPDPQDIVSPTGEVLATYTIKDNQVVVTFTKTVDIEEGNVGIVGGISCSFKLNDDKLQADKPTDADMVLQTGGTTYTFTAPKKSTDLVGIEKAGTYDRDKCAITWTITVGSDPQSVGVPLKGIMITDEYDKTKQGKADVTDAGGASLSITETDTGFEYTFPEDSAAVAPYELKVTVPVQDAVLDAAVNGDQELSNQVTMSSPKESSIQVAGEPGATGTVEVPKFSFSKQGTPLNSSTIAWELTVNQGGVGAANDVVVYDRLDARATYKDGTLTLDGQKIDVVYETAPDPAPQSTYAVLAKEAGGTWLLEVHIAGTVSTECHIAFETEIDASEHKNENIDFPNEAWIAYTWPNGYGPGTQPTPIDVNTDFQVAYLNKETPSYDPSTGEIAWNIVPSIRTDEYNTGIITDTIADDQEYIDGSVKVFYQGEELSSEELPGVFSYSEALKTLVFSFARDDYPLNDVAIEYRTQALNFKSENMEHHLYENTANLVVESVHGDFTAEDTASRSFRNEFLAKTSSYEVVDDQSGSTGYLHYRIVANASHMPSANLKVTDDLSSLVTEVVAADGTSLGTIEADKWSIAEGDRAIKVMEIAKDGSESEVTESASYSTEEWKTKRKIEATFSGADKTTNAYRIDLCLTLDRSVLQELHKQYSGEFVIRAQNTATASSEDFNGNMPTEVICEGTAGEGEIDNRLVAKSVDGSQQSEGILAYRININPNGADMQNVTLTDVPDGVLAIDLGSVQLHRATHGADGAIADALGNAVDASIWSKKLVHDAASGNTALSVGLPNGTASYVLTWWGP